MYRGGLQGLADWIHTNTRAAGQPRHQYYRTASPGAAHDDWAYDSDAGGWTYTHPSGPAAGRTLFTPGGPTGSHGGWDWVAGTGEGSVDDMNEYMGTPSPGSSPAGGDAPAVELGLTYDPTPASMAGIPVLPALAALAALWYLTRGG